MKDYGEVRNNKEALKSYSFLKFNLCIQLHLICQIQKHSQVNFQQLQVFMQEIRKTLGISSEIKCSDKTVWLLGQLDMKKFNQIVNQNQQYYKVTFWVKIQNEFDSENSCQPVYQLAAGSNSLFQLIFIIQNKTMDEQESNIILQCQIIVQFTDNNDSFLKKILYLFKIFLQQANGISFKLIMIQILQIFLQLIKQGEQIDNSEVNQFSNIYYRLCFGGSREGFSKQGRSFALTLIIVIMKYQMPLFMLNVNRINLKLMLKLSRIKKQSLQ
ncbi:unnamed protein product [Paramecium octaurelia]|uniref:Transmembrane protein n=1 Tax=Paramecium octaurelia TaxID=43137 RepID=A0A8S1WPD5_PAROT|nr:unnamed protein product [Paramecium octaurelia]